MSNCHETKSKHIDWTLGLKYYHRIWPWPWPWPWIFKIKYRICYISAKNGLIVMKRKANISIKLQASKVTNQFDLDHNLDLWILKVKRDLDLWPRTWPWTWIFLVKFWNWPCTWPWTWIFLVKFWNSCISEWEGQLTLHKGGGSRSFMTMTIWWPRSGVWIYQIVTGVTSVVDSSSYISMLGFNLIHVSKRGHWWSHISSLILVNIVLGLMGDGTELFLNQCWLYCQLAPSEI